MSKGVEGSDLCEAAMVRVDKSEGRFKSRRPTGNCGLNWKSGMERGKDFLTGDLTGL